MPAKHAFPISISVAEAAMNLARAQKRQRLKESGSETSGDPDAEVMALRKTTPRLPHAVGPDYEADNSMLVLPVAEVDYYEGNPRFDLGEDYPELKASIRAQGGLNNKISVTRRPGAARYMVEAGGNRRLRALKELAEEDSRFQQEIFAYRAWQGETTVLLRHLSENMQRADMTLWEQANGVLRLKRLLEQEHGESLSLRRFEEHLGDLGLPIGKSKLSVFGFTVERLAPLGRAAQFLSFKSARDVLQRGFNQLAQLAAVFAIDEMSLYAEVLTPVLEQTARECTEAAAFDADALYAQCEAALAQRLDASAKTLRQWLAVLRANPKATREDLRMPCESDAPAHGMATSASAPAILPQPKADGTGRGTGEAIDTEVGGDSSASAKEPSTPLVAAVHLAPVALSARLEQAITRFASEVGAAEYLRWQRDLPAGFYVEIPDAHYDPGESRSQDLPLEALEDDPGRFPLDIRSAKGMGNPRLYRGWWTLMELSGLVAEGSSGDLDEEVLNRLPQEATWRRAMSLGYEEIDRVFNEITGERPDLGFAFRWATNPGQPAGAALLALLFALREARGV